MFEPLLPEVRGPIPGPASKALAARLAAVECPDTTYIADDFPIFWDRAAGANVWDTDGNRYVDLTGAFGVAGPGHAHPAVVAAIHDQSARLVHAMGDVHPSAPKVRVAEALAVVAPGDLEVSLFGGSGFEAVEAALKTAVIATGKPGVAAFEGGYHGLGYGALAVTHRSDFRLPFAAQLNPHVRFLPFPAAHDAAAAAVALEGADSWLASAAGQSCGAIVVEPVQGRGGIRVPHASFLAGLREICSRRGALLVCDEILTGLGRTGRWFACEHSGVVPDLLLTGKILGGGLPLAACIGNTAVMQRWGRSTGEARHTSTFLGNPLACAAALATLEVLQREEWPARVDASAADFGAALQSWRDIPGVAGVRGLGLLWGVELRRRDGAPDGARSFEIVRRALQDGVLLLADGADRNVLAFMPPFAIAPAQRDAALSVVRRALVETAAEF